jgi:hypothetical protein
MVNKIKFCLWGNTKSINSISIIQQEKHPNLNKRIPIFK